MAAFATLRFPLLWWRRGESKANSDTVNPLQGSGLGCDQEACKLDANPEKPDPISGKKDDILPEIIASITAFWQQLPANIRTAILDYLNSEG
jgi:hypothetical protein